MLRSSFACLKKRSVLKAILNMEMPGLAITFAFEKSESQVINKWDFDEDNPNQIVYQWEDSSNVGCIVTFKPNCDTVFVTRYKW